MATSLNTKALLSVKAECFNTTDNYGKLLLGDKAFEFYSDRNPERNIQIPWQNIAYVHVEVYGRKYFGRYIIETTDGPQLAFAGKETKKVLQTMAQFIDPDHIVHADTLISRLKRSFSNRKNDSEGKA